MCVGYTCGVPGAASAFVLVVVLLSVEFLAQHLRCPYCCPGTAVMVPAGVWPAFFLDKVFRHEAPGAAHVHG